MTPRPGSDNSVSRPGRYIDDLAVQNCPASSCPTVVKGDFNKDSKVDLLFDNLTNNRNMVRSMDCITVTARAWIAPDPADDFNADHKSDLASWNGATGILEFWLMAGPNPCR